MGNKLNLQTGASTLGRRAGGEVLVEKKLVKKGKTYLQRRALQLVSLGSSASH